MEVDSAESKQTGLNGPYRSYYIAFIIVSVVALGLGLGLGLGLKKSPPPRALINIPPMQPPVTASVPNALRPSSATWVKTQSAADATRSSLMSLQSLTAGAARSAHFSVQAVTDNSSLTAIQNRVFGPGPTDFVTRLGKIDERIQELKTRNLESERGRVCIGEAAQLWTPNFLPAGVTFPMWFSCKEVMDPQGGLSVYFGTQGTTSYVAELQWPATAGTVPRMAVLAAVSNNGTQVEAWQIITGTNSVSYVQIRADRTTNSVEVRTRLDTSVGCAVAIFNLVLSFRVASVCLTRLFILWRRVFRYRTPTLRATCMTLVAAFVCAPLRPGRGPLAISRISLGAPRRLAMARRRTACAPTL